VGDKKKIEKEFTKYGDEIIILFKDVANVYKYITPPTKLKNNIVTRPFEALVKMYGVPSYNELDPTMFLSLTYMLFFGAMFGDVGQGLVLLLGGLILQRHKERKIYGSILARLGLSSTIFGFLYGSVFGFEEIVPALLIRPLDNINMMLMSSVVVGTIFLLISFGFNILNSYKQKNIQRGIFGRNGVNGLVFYIALLALVVDAFISLPWLPTKLMYLLIVVTMILMVLQEPLTNLIMNKRPLYHESISAYYVESGFDIFETFLNTLSNTISFIRVGAFALNHVGLFIAFETLAKLINNFAGSIIIYLIGNIIIIGLEGLIVFIQSLRLEYYELFSKYYLGDGFEFQPVRIGDR
jgi:V/A-type H+-transporting ATPase subunit I